MEFVPVRWSYKNKLCVVMVHVFSCWDVSALLFKFTPTHPLPPKNKNKTKQNKKKKSQPPPPPAVHIYCAECRPKNGTDYCPWWQEVHITTSTCQCPSCVASNDTTLSLHIAVCSCPLMIHTAVAQRLPTKTMLWNNAHCFLLLIRTNIYCAKSEFDNHLMAIWL